MNPIINGPVARRALALGLIAFAWLIPSASTPGSETLMAADAVAAAVEPDRIYLAQANAVAVKTRVSYSSDQADRGKAKYKKECLECHGENLKGGLNGGAPLRGLKFESKFTGGVPASALFAFMSATMPPNSPGRFSPNTYADLMAYILDRNGFSAGAPLPSDLNALGALIMEK